MLRQRVVTAIVLALITVWVVLKLPAIGFGAVLLAITLLGAWEWANLAGMNQTRSRLGYGALILALILAFWPLVDSPMLMNGLLILVFAGWCYVPIWLRHYARRPDRPDHLMTLGAVGIVILVGPWVALMGLRDKFGPGYVLFLLLLIWVADIGAYFAGRRWGRRKLAPAISPGKTWEGVWGAGAAALTFALIGAAVLGMGSRWLWFVAVCMVTVGFSIVGDLFESMIKRQRGVKDSGALLPGHGGVLDRIDSLTAAAPVFLLGLYGMYG
ncbi:phosphatidate cytidylyltransferase [Candidatus Contendibacter odensensis]|uniref:Phosphatidate cytidylyltransferase n=1 Tax=Candidatus Contendobacter odensis Run_B_J11 TaxID=1400861 RepID=A0A7U7GD76_9GAMM|nr:phosphatidate cytidylyltransferase [Candidatus Contendobacter odensis]CDH46057.1 putative Phosphatidate cytidylyltransferase [Candidatus Contendobacter odensis Run_B_J11]